MIILKKYFKGFTYFKLALKKMSEVGYQNRTVQQDLVQRDSTFACWKHNIIHQDEGGVYIKYTFQSTSQHQDALQWKVLHTAQQISFKDII